MEDHLFPPDFKVAGKISLPPQGDLAVDRYFIQGTPPNAANFGEHARVQVSEITGEIETVVDVVHYPPENYIG